MIACDSLYLRADVGSAYEEDGNACAYRLVPEEVLGRICVTIFR